MHPFRQRAPIHHHLLLMLAVFPVRGQAPIDADLLSRGPSPFPRFWRPYQPVPVPPPNLRNGQRLMRMIQEGKLQLSLDDFLQLVVENDFDLEAGRYSYLIAQTDLLRARSGQAARGLAGAPVPSGLFAGAIGAGVGNNANVSAGGTGGTAISAAARQVVIGPRGNFDPTFSANFSFDRVVSPLNTLRVAGTPTVTVPSTVLQTRFQQELPTGTSYSVTFNLQRQSSTQKFLLFDPAFTSFFSVAVYQPLLNGFGVALNRRFITVTEVNRKISREAFRQQLNNDLSAAAGLYWDSVALRERLRVAEESIAVTQQLYQNSQRQFEAGALARLDLVQAESQLAANRRDLAIAQTNLQMQEVKVKSVISRTINQALDQAQIEFTDALPQANAIDVPPLASALAEAMQNRSVIHQAEYSIDNQRSAHNFTRGNLRPTLSIFAQFNSYALAGGTNPMFRQMAQWQYPEYSAGLSLSFSLLNRSAQADDIRSRLELQQAEVSLQQTRSQVGLGVRTAVVGLIQYRAQIAAAQRALATSEQTFRGQQVRLVNGLATPYQLILAQRDFLAAQSAEIQARVNAAKAIVAQQVSTGTFLESHHISFEDALKGGLWTGSMQP